DQDPRDRSRGARGGLRAGLVRRCRSRRHRRGAWRLARHACRRHGGGSQGDAGARRPRRTDPCRHWALYRPALLRSRRGIFREFYRHRSRERSLFRPRVAPRPFPVRSAGLYRAALAAARARGGRARAARHGGRRGAVLQLSPRLPAGRAGLWAWSRCHRTDRLERRALSRAVRRVLLVRSPGHLRADVMRVPHRSRRPLRGPSALAVPVLAVAVTVSACQPLPHPFADDRPPASLLRVRDSAAISIAPVKTWETGADAVIARLAEASAAEIAPLLADESPPGAEAVAGLAEAPGGKAEAVAPRAEAAAAKTNEAGRTRIAIRPLSGAPGDGAKSLANAIATVLKRQDLTVIDNANAKADVILDGQVTVATVKPDKQ